MCTVSWLREVDGYQLFFNRDESVTRQRALPPRRVERVGVAVIAPQDADAGGTWIAVNEFGLTVCLLNAYGEDGPEPASGWVSRGLLVDDLSVARSVESVEETLRALDLRVRRGFRLTAISPDAGPRTWHWDGRRLDEEVYERSEPLASSSRDTARAERERSQVFQQLRERRGAVDVELLAEFHRGHVPERGPWSVCMHRDDASTVSASHIAVDADRVRFAYADGPPCSAPWSAALEMARS